MPFVIGGRMHVMFLSVARLQLKQLRDVDCVCAVLKENYGMMCTAIVSEVGMSAASFAFPLNRKSRQGLCKLDATHAE
jgi:hypothetical protein